MADGKNNLRIFVKAGGGLLHMVERDGCSSSWGQAITRARLCRRLVCKQRLASGGSKEGALAVFGIA